MGWFSKATNNLRNSVAGMLNAGEKAVENIDNYRNEQHAGGVNYKPGFGLDLQAEATPVSNLKGSYQKLGDKVVDGFDSVHRAGVDADQVIHDMANGAKATYQEAKTYVKEAPTKIKNSVSEKAQEYIDSSREAASHRSAAGHTMLNLSGNERADTAAIDKVANAGRDVADGAKVAVQAVKDSANKVEARAHAAHDQVTAKIEKMSHKVDDVLTKAGDKRDAAMENAKMMAKSVKASLGGMFTREPAVQTLGLSGMSKAPEPVKMRFEVDTAAIAPTSAPVPVGAGDKGKPGAGRGV